MLVAGTLAVEAVAVALSWGLEPTWDTVLYGVYAVTLVGTGALIVSRHPGHRIGWLFCATGIYAGLGDLAQGWGLRAAQQDWPGGPLGEWISLSDMCTPNMERWKHATVRRLATPTSC